MPAKPAFSINGATTTTQQHNSRWELGMIVFTRLGGRGSVAVRGMIVFNRPSNSNSTLLSLRFVLFTYFPRRQTKVIEVSSLVGILQFISARLRDVHHDVTRPRPALPALAQTQPSPCPRLRLCCLVFFIAHLKFWT